MSLFSTKEHEDSNYPKSSTAAAMTASKENLEERVPHKEVTIADPEKTHEVESKDVQDELQHFEKRRIDLRTMLALWYV